MASVSFDVISPPIHPPFAVPPAVGAALMIGLDALRNFFKMLLLLEGGSSSSCIPADAVAPTALYAPLFAIWWSWKWLKFACSATLLSFSSRNPASLSKDISKLLMASSPKSYLQSQDLVFLLSSSRSLPLPSFWSSFAVSLLGGCCLCSVLDPADFRGNTKRSYQIFFWCHWFWTLPCLFPWWVPWVGIRVNPCFALITSAVIAIY